MNDYRQRDFLHDIDSKVQGLESFIRLLDESNGVSNELIFEAQNTLISLRQCIISFIEQGKSLEE